MREGCTTTWLGSLFFICPHEFSYSEIYLYICKNCFMTKENPYSAREEQIARISKAMGHPARIAILHFLAKRDSCYFGAIHEELPIAKATVSQHLKELKDAGLIQGEIEPPRVKYCINRANWKMAQYLMSEFFGQLFPEKKERCCE